MRHIFHRYKISLLFTVALLLSATASNAQVTFRASAPGGVVKGEQFRLSYTLNKEGKDLRLPDMKGFDVLFGPATSRSFSQSTVNGKTTSETEELGVFKELISTRGIF